MRRRDWLPSRLRPGSTTDEDDRGNDSDNAETAQVLELRESATSKRYVRALQRLKAVLQDLPGGLEEVRP